MGEIYWDMVPGVTRIATWPDLRAAMRTPVDQMERVRPEDARHFVAALAEFSHKGRPLPNPKLNDPDNIAAVREAVLAGAGLEGAGLDGALREAAE